MTSHNVLELEHVSHAYDNGIEVLHDVSLAVAEGEILCLLGPSGCGKTTSLRLAAGLEECQQGRVRIGGQVVSGGSVHIPPEGRSVGMVFQDMALFPHLTAAGNVGFGLSTWTEAARKARITEILRQVGMEDYANAYPHTMSGGQQQRIALARALAPGPRLMLLDEPFSGLDAQLRAVVREETLSLLKAHGTATLVVTHDPEEAMYIADRIAVMNRGRVEQVGRPDAIYNNPANPFVTRFFSSTNRFTSRVAGGEVPTSFGPLQAPPGIADGEEVQVLIRPEALRIGAPGATPPPDCIGSVAAQVETARILRRSVIMHLSLRAPDGTKLRFHARDPGHHIPEGDGRISVSLDPRQAFVFRMDACCRSG